jgi:hypothetical protein
LKGIQISKIEFHFGPGSLLSLLGRPSHRITPPSPPPLPLIFFFVVCSKAIDCRRLRAFSPSLLPRGRGSCSSPYTTRALLSKQVTRPTPPSPDFGPPLPPTPPPLHRESHRHAASSKIVSHLTFLTRWSFRCHPPPPTTTGARRHQGTATTDHRSTPPRQPKYALHYRPIPMVSPRP